MSGLPLADDPPRERADAARNRALVLQAAWRLYTHGGVEALTTDAVAQEAGVGKGTVYRRFRDKSGLVAALLDDKEKELQLAMVSGPPPLGPDAATQAERRVAFVHAYLDYMQAHLDLLLASETAAPGARYRLGVYQFWKTHLTMLFAEDAKNTDDTENTENTENTEASRKPPPGAPDPEFRAYTVLALLDASLVSHLLADGWTWDRIRAGVDAEARR